MLLFDTTYGVALANGWDYDWDLAFAESKGLWLGLTDLTGEGVFFHFVVNSL